MFWVGLEIDLGWVTKTFGSVMAKILGGKWKKIWNEVVKIVLEWGDKNVLRDCGRGRKNSFEMA